MDEAKGTLRRRFRKIRAAMPPDQVRQSSRAVCEHLSGWHLFRQARVALTFLAFRNEIDLSPLFERWPEKTWLVPRVFDGEALAAGAKPYLVIHHYDPSRVVRHRFGMLEPDPTLPVVSPDQVDLILVPGLAFDRRGGRMGYGGGFYDRLLPQAHRAASVGVTYDDLIVDEIPMEPWDWYVDWLVTPAGLIKAERPTSQI
jgi:5-formyltetrahydrofolate cyclo-ligase